MAHEHITNEVADGIGMLMLNRPEKLNAYTNWKTQILEDGRTAVTLDGSLSAPFEHTVLVTEYGVEVLTLGKDEQPLV